MHIIIPSFGVFGGGGLIYSSVICSIVVLFYVCIGAVLLLCLYVFIGLCTVFWTDYICCRL